MTTQHNQIPPNCPSLNVLTHSTVYVVQTSVQMFVSLGHAAMLLTPLPCGVKQSWKTVRLLLVMYSKVTEGCIVCQGTRNGQLNLYKYSVDSVHLASIKISYGREVSVSLVCQTQPKGPSITRLETLWLLSERRNNSR